jgi:putative transposase
MSSKSSTIKETMRQTKLRRKQQTCHVYQIKVDKSRLSPVMKQALSRLFLEAKWLYNAALATESFYDFDTRTKSVDVLCNDVFELRDLTLLSSQMKQAIISRMAAATRALHALKLKGKKVGALKFKAYINSIPLKQFGKTYRILDSRRISIQNLPEPIYVFGLKQLDSSEIANANLVRQGTDYFLMVTTYQDKVAPESKPYFYVGIDFNIEAGAQLVLNNGVAIGFNVETHKDERIKDAQRKLARQDRTNKKRGISKHTKNRFKTISKIKRLHQRHTNKRNEIRNQIVHQLAAGFQTICFQKENISGWQRLWGKRIHGTALAGIIERLNTSSTTKVTDRFVATTKTCHVCGTKNQALTLDDKWWTCPNPACNTRHNRHVNAAINMLPGSERASTSAESISSATSLLESLSKLDSIGVRVRLLVETDNSSCETGSPRL